jgi:hypothetical protein
VDEKRSSRTIEEGCDPNLPIVRKQHFKNRKPRAKRGFLLRRSRVCLDGQF